MLLPSVHALLSWYTLRSLGAIEWKGATFAIETVLLSSIDVVRRGRVPELDLARS
jgi:hypothetical protein